MNLFHSETMSHVSLYMRFFDAPMASVVLAKTGFFDPTMAASKNDHLPERQGIAYRRIFNHALSNWQKSSEYLTITPHSSVNRISAINKHQLLEIESRVASIWKTCTQHKEQKRLLDNKIVSLNHLFKLFDHYNNLDINLSLLKSDMEFLDIRLGIIPTAYINRIKEALAIEGYYLSVYLHEEESVHIIVAGLKQADKSIESLLESASFQMLQVPDEFHEHPKTVYEKLQLKQQNLFKQIDNLKQEYSLLKKQFTDEIIELGDSLTLAKPYAVLSKDMLRNGQLTKVNGWVPTSKVGLIQSSLDKYIHDPVVLDVRKPKVKEFHKTPSYLVRPNWLEPFLKLVTNYGVPGYKEFDPSWFFTLSYIFMFGLMFGDVGHGLCIFLLSWLIKSKRPQFFSFFIAIGISSMLFGFLYGSIFSYEHVLPAIWLSPIEHPMLMLKLALAWGVTFIVFLNSISIYNYVITLQLKEALFNPRGMSGLVLYITIILAIIALVYNQFSNINILLISAPLVIIFSYYWKKSSGNYSERVLVCFIETYDIIIGYVSNTISFLRVAAFALNHSALAIALFTMAAMTDGGGHWVTIILGNIFILVLEGAIVIIQVLRLEYYEGFSRFFNGDGYLFKPMELSPQKLI
jgi:V/A-type H+/Na+-transporting ATPase subunit I